MATIKLIKKQYECFNKDPPSNITVGVLSEENFFSWHAAIIGPPNSPYEGGVFFISILFPNDYPFKPPKCTCITKIYHPNINSYGTISTDILRPEYWSVMYTITNVLVTIYSILKEPDPEHPLVPEIMYLYDHDRAKYNEIAREWTKKYAS